VSKFNFEEGAISGFFTLSRDSFEDHRGSFSRLYSRPNFFDNSNFLGIENVNLSVNPKKYTLRGFHYSEIDANETKIFCCVSGGIFNVTIDVRKNSETYGQKQIIELSASDNISIIVPSGCANAWMTMQTDTRIVYLVSSEYQFDKERGIRYDDPILDIKWPAVPMWISEKDLSWSPFTF